VADVESMTEENGRLKQVVDSLNVETKKVRQERDTAVRCHRQAQEELGPLKMELSVAVRDLMNARTIQGMQQKEIDRLTGELGKKSFLAQANLKKIVDKFREQTNVAIQVAMATALREWSKQAAKLQVLRADKANQCWGRRSSGGTSTGFQQYGGGVKKWVDAERRLELKEEASDLFWFQVAAKDTRE
jgi:hypothetical protein